MNPFQAYQNIAETNQWLLIWPEVALGVLALGLLVMDLLLHKEHHVLIARAAIVGQVFVLMGLLSTFVSESNSFSNPTGTPIFGGMLALTTMGQAARVFIVVTSLLVCHLAQLYFKDRALPKTEFYHIVLVIAAAMMLLVQSANFVMLFVALETVTVGFYVLVAYCRPSPLSLEAGLKYLILGALSSAILLFGIVLLYGVAGDPAMKAHAVDAMSFSDLGHFIASNPANPLIETGVALVLCGVSFKIGLVPFQIWIPDVYQGAPTPTAAFLAVGSKAAGFFVLLNLVSGPFAAPELAQRVLVPLLSTLAALSILYGNLAALTQRNVKRVMGLSGIAHAGYIMLGVVAGIKGVPWAPGAVLFYLVTYMLASMAVFGVMAHVAGPADEAQEIEHYAELGKRQPFLGGVLAMGLGSLAGIPPLAGFIGKLLLFFAAFQAGMHKLLAVAIVGVVISIYYYFGWMREALFHTAGIPGMPVAAENDGPRAPTPWSRITLGLLAAATLLVGLYQGFLNAAWL